MEKQPPERREPLLKRLKPKGKPTGWVIVADAPNQIAAGMLKSALMEADIPVMLQGGPITAFLGVGGVQSVLVPEECAKEARDILREIWDIEE